MPIVQVRACASATRGSAAHCRQFNPKFAKGELARKLANRVVHCQRKAAICPKTDAFQAVRDAKEPGPQVGSWDESVDE